MFRIRLTSKGAEPRAVAADLRAFRARLSDVSPVAPRLLRLFADAAVRRIREGRVGGPPLSPLTRAIRERRGYGSLPAFVRTGELLNSIAPKQTHEKGGTFGPDVTWDALSLHDGGEVIDRHGRRHTLPPRPFLEPDSVDIEDGAEVLGGFIVGGES